MGSVTYRLLCLAPTLVLALPPEQVDRAIPAVPSWAVACAAGNC
jgi:hypothetical protein